jgi:hypothetical protein
MQFNIIFLVFIIDISRTFLEVNPSTFITAVTLVTFLSQIYPSKGIFLLPIREYVISKDYGTIRIMDVFMCVYLA